MHRYFRFALVGAAIAPTFISASALALTGITAEEAFDSVQTQTDPLTRAPAKVALVDVRTRAEYYWVGAPTKVDQIVLKHAGATSIVPDLGKVKFVHEGRFLEYAVHGKHRKTQVSKVQELKMSPIARNIPYKLWDESTAKLSLNTDFNDQIAELKSEGVQVLIVFCRSGSRSSTCSTQIENANLFWAVYEIDDPTPGSAGGVGGFEGNPYNDVYNGYHGFPDRPTEVQDVPSVSWKDTGLPIKISMDPFALPQ